MKAINIIFENATRASSFGAWKYVRGIKFSGHIFGGGGDDTVYSFHEFWGMVSCYLYKGDTTIHRSNFSDEEWIKILEWASAYVADHYDCKLIIE